MTAPEPWFCGERLTFRPRPSTRTVVTCVDRPDHDPQAGHRSGTDPVIRWRTNRQDPNVIDAWIERWRGLGRPVAEREAAGLPT